MYWKVSLGTQRLSVIRNSEVVCYSGAENVVRLREAIFYPTDTFRSLPWAIESSWYIHGGPLFGGGPLLGGSVIGGSTVLWIREG